MKFSIITVNLNSGNDFFTTAASIRSQNFRDWQWIIKDGASNDLNPDTIPNDHRIVFRQSPDTGVYEAMNEALTFAEGEYIIFLNSGDTFAFPRTLSALVEKITQYPGKRLFYGNARLNETLLHFPKDVTKAFLFRKSLCHQATVFHQQLFNRFGAYDTTFTIRGDHEFLLRLHRAGIEFQPLDMIIALYKPGGLSGAPQQQPLNKAEIRKLRKAYFRVDERIVYKCMNYFYHIKHRASLQHSHRPQKS